jgi:hypothetical protein
MPSLLPFRANQQALWFVQVVAAFASCRIIVQVRIYHHVLYSLPQMVLDRVADMLAAAEPPSDAYQRLKERLLQEYQVSAFKRVPRLRLMPPLGGGDAVGSPHRHVEIVPPRGEGNRALQRDVLLPPAPVGQDLTAAA